jgi:hypothetical protein
MKEGSYVSTNEIYLGNGGIRFDLNYLVINETNQNKEYSFIICQFKKIICFRVSVSLTSKVIKATFNFSRVSKYWVSKMNTDNEW